MIAFKKHDIDMVKVFALIGVYYLSLWAINFWVLPNSHPSSYVRVLSVSSFSFLIGILAHRFIYKNERVQSKKRLPKR